MTQRKPAQDDRRIGAMLREARTTRGWTQEEVARRLGVRQGAISSIEAGRHLTLRTLTRLASEYGISLDELLLKRPVTAAQYRRTA